MRSKLLIVLLAFLLASTASAATCKVQEGDKLHCYERWENDSDSGWPGWADDMGVNRARVSNGSGRLHVEADGPEHYNSNHAHLTWTDAGAGFDWVRINGMAFAGDGGHTGWYDKLSNGSSLCYPLQNASRASEESLMLTLGDDGDSYVGGVLGGDLLALGVTIPPFENHPPHSYAVIGVVQKLPGQAPKVLAWTLGPPIPMHDTTRNLTVWVEKLGNVWYIKAKGDENNGGRDNKDWMAIAPMEGEPNFGAGVGIDTVVLPRSYCIYYGGGSIDRQFTIGNIEARQP